MATKCVLNKSTLSGIADAIRAKGGTDSPMRPREMAEAIEAIPSGGIDLISIKKAVKTMDGITRENPDGTELARAITEITRQPNRRGESVADEPKWTADAGKTAFVVKVDESVGLDFIIGCMWLKSGSASATIDWGDGTQSIVTKSGVICEGHLYAEAGRYLVQISDDITRFYPHLNEFNATNFNSTSGRLPQGTWSTQPFDGSRSYAKANNDNIDKVYRAIQWGANITNAYSTYNGCLGLTGTVPEWGSAITNAYATYYNCSGLIGTVPEWGPSITDAYATYYNCSGLTGAVPAWGVNITNAYATYYNCSGLTGTIPEWGVNITSAYMSYNGCSGLTGSVPEWGAKIKNVSSTYNGCLGLTGTVPEWGEAITTASSTYFNCSGLTGTVPEWGEAITTAHSTYYGCSGLTGTIPEWGVNITTAQRTYYGCSGLKGAIPSWGPKITNAQETYLWCFGLTSIWDESAPDAEIMPSLITSKSNCVNNTSQALREFFLTAWGGTRNV